MILRKPARLMLTIIALAALLAMVPLLHSSITRALAAGDTSHPTLTLTTYNGTAKGGPGTSIQLNGSGFAAHETTEVYWQSTSGGEEGVATTDNYGNLSFSFTAPTALTPDNYPVIVARHQQQPPTVSALFTVIPPQMTLTHGSSRGVLHLQNVGFQAGETVSFSWNANGGQNLFTNRVDSNGAGYYDIYVPGLPPAPRGSYTLTGTGLSSGIQATASISTKPAIVLNPTSVNPGGTLTVSGSNYIAGETVHVFVQNVLHGVVSVAVDSTGSFTAILTVPGHYSPKVSYYVYAMGTSSDQAKALLQFTPPQLSTLYNSPYPYNSAITFYGQGFLANEQVTVWWNYKQQGQRLVDRTTADSFGGITDTINTPSDPNVTPVTIAAIGDTSKLKATASIDETAALLLNPSAGIVGTRVDINGGGFAAWETVTLSFQGNVVGTVAASKSGAIYSTFTIPGTAVIGNNTFQAKGGTSGISVTAIFVDYPTLIVTPTLGPAGTTVTVTGSYYSPSSTVSIDWFYAMYNTTFLTSATTSSRGTFTVTITVPSNVFRGNSYEVWGVDGPTGAIGFAPFFVP